MTNLCCANKQKKTNTRQEVTVLDGAVTHSLLDQGRAAPAPSNGQHLNNNNHKTKRVIQEICAFLILSNIMVCD